MRNASGHQGKNEQQRKKREQDYIQQFLHKTFNSEVSGSFTLSSCKQRQRNVQESVLHVQSCFFFLIRATGFLWAVLVAVAA